MRRLTHPERGLFPQPKEIKMKCSCPDWAVLCKHVAAVLYGVGARLDQEPQLLFVLRGVDHAELVSQAVSDGNLDTALRGTDQALAGEDLGAMFGIELDSAGAAETPTKAKRGRRSSARRDASMPTAKSRSKKTLPEAAVVVKEKAGATRSATKPGRGIRAKSQPAAAGKSAAGAELQPSAKKRASRRA